MMQVLRSSNNEDEVLRAVEGLEKGGALTLKDYTTLLAALKRIKQWKVRDTSDEAWITRGDSIRHLSSLCYGVCPHAAMSSGTVPNAPSTGSMTLLSRPLMCLVFCVSAEGAGPVGDDQEQGPDAQRDHVQRGDGGVRGGGAVEGGTRALHHIFDCITYCFV
jgi:hypothetical protein